MNWAGRNLAFVHFGKAGGQYVAGQMVSKIIPDHRFLSSWRFKLGRDWTDHELHEIAARKILSGKNSFAINHQNNFSASAIKSFSSNGWKVFTFLRDPREIICSLYFYGQKLIREKKDCPGSPFHSQGVLAGHRRPGEYQPPDVTALTLDQVFQEMLNREELARFWQIPDHLLDLDFVDEFTPGNFSRFTLSRFGIKSEHGKKVNSSGNQGFAFYLKENAFSSQTKNLLKSNKGIQRCDLILLDIRQRSLA